MMEQDMQQILFTQDQVAARVQELAAQITRDYAGKTPLVVGVPGVRSFSWPTWCGIWTSPLTLDFMAASSYGAGTTSSGLVNIRLDLHDDIAGRDVLLVGGYLGHRQHPVQAGGRAQGRHPASLKLCVLLDKPERRTRPLEADYVGFTIPDAFRGGLRPGLRPKNTASCRTSGC